MSRQAGKGEGLPYRRCAVGAAAAVVLYLLFQVLAAALVNGRVMELRQLPVLLAPGAGIGVLVGGLIAGRGQGSGRALICGVVLAGFLLIILAISMTGGGKPWAAPAGGSVLLGSLLGALLSALTGGRRKRRSPRRKH